MSGREHVFGPDDGPAAEGALDVQPDLPRILVLLRVHATHDAVRGVRHTTIAIG